VYHPEGDYIISVLTKEVATNKDGKEIIGLVSKEVFNSIKMF